MRNCRHLWHLLSLCLFQWSSVSLKIILTFLRLVCATNALERFLFAVILWYWRNRGASRFEKFRHFDRFSPGGDKVDQVDPHSLCRQFRKWQLHSQCLPHLLLPVAGSGQEVSESIRDKRSRCLSLTRFFVIRWAFTEHLLVKVWLALHFETLSIRWMQNLIYIASLSLNFKRIDGWRMCAIFMWLQANATRVLYGGCSLRRFAQHWLSPTWRVRFWEHCKVCDSWSWSSLHRGCWFFLWWY